MSARADRFTVILDTNVLVGALSRNLLLSLAEAGIFRPRWTRHVMDEFEEVFARRFNDAETARTQRERMERAFPEATVDDYEELIEAITLPDADDRHVVAAAILTKAALIVTDNLKDFPAESLAPYEILAISLDDFLADQLDLAGPEGIVAVRRMRQRFRKPDLTADALIVKIEELGLVQTADLLTSYRDLL